MEDGTNGQEESSSYTSSSQEEVVAEPPKVMPRQIIINEVCSVEEISCYEEFAMDGGVCQLDSSGSEMTLFDSQCLQ